MSSSVRSFIDSGGSMAELYHPELKAFYWVGEEGTFESGPGKVYCTFNSAVSCTAALGYIALSQRTSVKHQQKGKDRLPYDIDAVLINKQVPNEPYVVALQVEVKNEGSKLATQKFTTHRMLIDQIISTTNVVKAVTPSLEPRKITVQRTSPELFAYW